MKKAFKKIISAMLAATMCFSVAACSPATPDGGDTDESVDTMRTQLYVYNFNGGFGTEWLKAAKTRFEAKHAEDELESGKKGVQVIIKANKDSNNGDTFWNNIPKAREEVYFVEGADYYKLVGSELMLDITDAVTSPLSEYGETESIKDKMTAEQQAYYGVGADGKYYGVPHYAGYWGIIYNKDLFDSQGYYFADDQSYFENTNQLAFRFVQNEVENTKKSAGPDGKYDTEDDGLPTTYEEFFLLCDYIKEKKDIPIQWRGVSYSDYVQTISNTFAVDFEGKEQWMLNYDFGSGTAKQATSLGKVVNGAFVRDSKPTTITAENGYELARQEGKWHAVELMQKMCAPSYNEYHNDKAYNNSYSHLDAQSDFLYGGIDGSTKAAAMLFDGVWWQMEAASAFSDIVKRYGEDYSEQNRKFALMPLPKANAEKLAASRAEGAKNQTMYDAQYSLAFVKSNIDESKKAIAVDFIRFVNSQESLVEYTTITNTTKALQYSLTDEQKSKLSYFGRSVIDLQERSDVVYPYSTNAKYQNNASQFRPSRMYRTTATTKEYAPSTFHEETSVTAEAYFNGMADYLKNLWPSLN